MQRRWLEFADVFVIALRCVYPKVGVDSDLGIQFDDFVSEVYLPGSVAQLRLQCDDIGSSAQCWISLDRFVQP